MNCFNFCPGTLTSITNFASSVSRNMERLSFDVDHIQRSEVLRRHKPSHVSEGLKNGLSGLGLSILGVFLCCVFLTCVLCTISFMCHCFLAAFYIVNLNCDIVSSSAVKV